MSLLEQHSWVLLPLAAALSAVLAWVLIPLAPRIGWMDHPGERKVHEDATPPAGGPAIGLALIVVVFLLPDPAIAIQPFFRELLAVGLVLMLTGVIDDLRELSAAFRFVVQVVICVLMIQLTGVRLDDFGQLFTNDILYLGWLAIPITVFAAMGVINSFNMVDGLDGLSGAIFVVATSGMAFFAAQAGRESMSWFLCLSIAAVLGFLLLNARFPWNRRARIFLGNSGALMLGLVLAWCFVRLGSGAHRAFMPMTAVWLFAVPLLDTSTQIRRRWAEGRSAFSADQNHLHHAFLRAGFSVGQTWSGVTLLAVALAVMGIGFELSKLPEWISFYTFMLVAFTYYFYMKHCWASQQFLGRHFIHHDFVVEEDYS